MWAVASPDWEHSRRVEAEVKEEVRKQIELDMLRTDDSMLFGHASTEKQVSERKLQICGLLIEWLENQEDLVYMQGMHLIMCTCVREMKDGEGALRAFDFLVRQANQDLFHSDVEKLMGALHDLASKLRATVQEQSPKLAEKLVKTIDFFPMLVQNWLIDLFAHVLQATAAARLWDHIFQSPNVPLKFASQLLLSSKMEILLCEEEEIHEILSDLPTKVQTSDDVDRLLNETFEDSPEVHEDAAPEVQEFGIFQLQQPMQQANEFVEKLHENNVVLTVRRAVRLPKRWQPWKFVTVAMVVPWLLMRFTLTSFHNPALTRRVPFPVQRGSFPAHVVPMDEANWPPLVRRAT